MTAAEVVDIYARERVVEKMAAKICRLPEVSADLKDLSQIVYTALLDYGRLLVEVESKGQTRFLIARIIKNQYFSKTSVYHYAVRVFRHRASEEVGGER